MSLPPIISYPSTFLERPEDRAFLMELSMAGVHKDTARLILYRIWADFATDSGKDRRPVEQMGLDACRGVRVLEQFCEWQGKPGELVRMAISTGFLNIVESGEISMLVCKGFYPVNSAAGKGRSIQHLGGYVRSLNQWTRDASHDAAQRGELWQRTGNKDYQDIPPATRERALQFVYQVQRVMGFSVPSENDFQSGLFRLALQCIDGMQETEIRRTLLWLVSRRREPDIPDRLDAVLRAWPTYVSSSASEES